jgi:WD40 repeat protein
LAFPFFTLTPTSWASPSPFAHFACAALAPNGRYLAASWKKSTVALVDIAEGTPARQFPVPNGEEIVVLAISPNGKLLAGAFEHRDGYGVLLWDIRTRALQKRLVTELERFYGINFSPDSKFMVCSHSEGIALYETSTWERRPLERGDLPAAAAFSPDSQTLAYSANKLRAIRLWNISMNRYIATLGCSGAVWMDYSKDGKTLVAVGRRTVRIWNLAGASEKLMLGGHAAAVSSLVFSPDGQLLATSGRDHKIKIWQPQTGTLLKELKEFSTSVEGLSFSSDGRILAAGNFDNGTVRFYDVASWKPLPAMQPLVGGTVLATAFSPDGQYFAAAGTNGLTLWRRLPADGDQAAGPFFQAVDRLSDTFCASLCFSPDGNWLAWSDGDWGRDPHTVHVWDLRRLQPYALSMAKNRSGITLGFFADSKHLAFVNDKLMIAVWDVTKKQELSSFGDLEPRGVVSPATELSVSGAWYAAADQTLTIWDMAARRLLVALSPERSSACSVGWSPDQKLLAVGGYDGSVEIWNLPKINAKLAEIGLDW